jgi:hypothetical protein
MKTTMGIAALMASTGLAWGQVSITLGEQDFADGDGPITGPAFSTAGAGEASPFNAFNGSDSGSLPANFDASWSYAFAPVAGATSASLTFGIHDKDEFVAGDQVANFDVDGVDLTAALNALFEAAVAPNGTVSVITIDLTGLALAAVSDGSATFSLRLQSGDLTAQSANGAGLDFATLRVVPSPGAAAVLGLGGVVAARRRR